MKVLVNFGKNRDLGDREPLSIFLSNARMALDCWDISCFVGIRLRAAVLGRFWDTSGA